MLFRDRADAGRQLAAKLTDYAGRTDVLVLALPRGGVPVGHEVAQCRRAPWMSFSSANWACPDARSWPWARWPAAAFAS